MKLVQSFKNLRLSLQLNIIVSLLIIFFFSIFGIYIYYLQKERILADTDLRMEQQVNDLVEIIDIQIQSNQQYVNKALKVAHYVFYNEGDLRIAQDETIEVEAQNQISKQVSTETVPAWYFRGEKLHKNSELVDDIKNLLGGTVTIFQRIPDGFLRISTNVMRKDGKRATGTYIPNNSPVIETVLKGETYRGRAFVVDDWYLTAYEPIKENGEIVGMLYVGVKEKNLKEIKEYFASQHYLESGYPFVVNSKGTFIVHPTSEGENVADKQFFQQIINSPEKEGKSRYKWPETQNGKWKFQYFKYYEPIDAYVVSSIYEEDLLNLISRLKISILISAAIALLLFIVILRFIIASIVKRIKGAVVFTEKISGGSLYQNFDDSSRDEVGQMAHSLNEMSKKLREIVSSIKSGADSIVAASRQISSSSEQIAQGAGQQASATQEVSSSMEEMVSSINQNTDNAQQTEKTALKAAQDIQKVNQAFETTVEAMTNIAEKISVVDEIAEKTDLLAVNAAIEAARAGEHGKGFAVVALEVRKLSEKTQKAAAEIVGFSHSSLKIAREADKLLGEVVPVIENNASLVREIAAASLEQNSGVEQINTAIQQLAQITQQNSAAAEELATGSEQMSAQALQLKETISFFRTQEQDQGKLLSNLMKQRDDLQKTIDMISATQGSFTTAHLAGKTERKEEESTENDPENPNGVHIDMGDETDDQFEHYEDK